MTMTFRWWSVTFIKQGLSMNVDLLDPFSLIRDVQYSDSRINGYVPYK